MSSTLIIRLVTRLLTPVIIAASLYLLWRGHDAVGGGFIGGLVAGSAVVLHFFAADGRAPRIVSRPNDLLAVGLLVAAVYGVAGILLGGGFLAGAVRYVPVPLLGEVKFAASLIFDIGVFVLVLGAVGSVLHHLGEGSR